MVLLAAIVSGLATISAAALAFVASERRRAALEALAKSDDKRKLTLEELEYIQLSSTVEDQLTERELPSKTNGPANVRLVYPGSERFKSIRNSRDGAIYDRTESTTYSAIEVLVDGTNVGSGNGERGFAISFEADVGRHNLVFMWKGEKRESVWANTPAGRDRDKKDDLSGRTERVFWAVRSGACVLHLDQDFQIDHVSPEIVVPSCVGCRMPGVRQCKCGRKYCLEHVALINERQVCVSCKEEDLQKKLLLAKYGAISVAATAALFVVISIVWSVFNWIGSFLG